MRRQVFICRIFYCCLYCKFGSLSSAICTYRLWWTHFCTLDFSFVVLYMEILNFLICLVHCSWMDFDSFRFSFIDKKPNAKGSCYKASKGMGKEEVRMRIRSPSSDHGYADAWEQANKSKWSHLTSHLLTRGKQIRRKQQ